MSYKTLNSADIPYNSDVKKFEIYWYKLFNDRGIACKKTMNPIDIPKILRWAVILEKIVAENPNDGSIELPKFVIRLCGTGCVQIFGGDYTGVTFGDALKESYKAILYKEMLSAVQDQNPHFSRMHVPLENRDFIQITRGIFPLSSDGLFYDYVISVMTPMDGSLCNLKSPNHLKNLTPGKNISGTRSLRKDTAHYSDIWSIS